MYRKQVTSWVLLDLSKAFDSIDHMSLLKKLRAMGTCREAMEWARSYLTGGKQLVRIGCETSEPRLVSYGVPQGSILGPALFNIYINDLPSVPKVGSLESYVDDSQLYLSFKFPVRDAADQLTKDLRNIAVWCCTNSVLINPDKTVTSSNVLRKGSLQTILNAGLSEQQQEDLFQNERSFHEVKLLTTRTQ